MLQYKNMNEALKHLFKTLAPFEEDELDSVSSLFKPESLAKGEYFSKAGLISDRIAFVNKGLLRSFYDVKGKDTTTFFMNPGTVAVALISFLQMKPAIENIQAIEPSELLIIPKKDLLQLYKEDWKWQQVGRVLVETYYIKMEQRLIAMQSQTAQERYEILMHEFPEIIQTIPLHYIASYLGMSPETLSRVRKLI